MWLAVPGFLAQLSLSWGKWALMSEVSLSQLWAVCRIAPGWLGSLSAGNNELCWAAHKPPAPGSVVQLDSCCVVLGEACCFTHLSLRGKHRDVVLCAYTVPNNNSSKGCIGLQSLCDFYTFWCLKSRFLSGSWTFLTAELWGTSEVTSPHPLHLNCSELTCLGVD